MSASGEMREHYVDGRLWLEYPFSSDAPAFLSVVPYQAPTPLVVDFHQGFEVGVLLAGAQRRSFDSFSYGAAPGEVWLCAGWEPHGWMVLTAGTVAVVLTFLPEFLGEAMIGGAPWLRLFAIPAPARPRVSDRAQRACALRLAGEWAEERARPPAAWLDVVRYDLLRLLAGLCRGWSPPQSASGRTAPRLGELAQVEAALRLVHEEPTRRISLAEAAAACHLGRSQFCRVFKRSFGMSFGQFAQRSRLGVAARELLSTRTPIEAIAFRLGFNSLSQFYRGFEKQYGCTPRAFREQGKSASDR
jgi:AraC-like DNA-binding protein